MIGQAKVLVQKFSRFQILRWTKVRVETYRPLQNFDEPKYLSQHLRYSNDWARWIVCSNILRSLNTLTNQSECQSLSNFLAYQGACWNISSIPMIGQAELIVQTFQRIKILRQTKVRVEVYRVLNRLDQPSCFCNISNVQKVGQYSVCSSISRMQMFG